MKSSQLPKDKQTKKARKQVRQIHSFLIMQERARKAKLDGERFEFIKEAREAGKHYSEIFKLVNKRWPGWVSYPQSVIRFYNRLCQKSIIKAR